MELMDAVKNRYSCRSFEERPVEQKALMKILEAGQLAPTAKNLQEQHIYVLQSPESLAKMDEVSPCRYHSPTVLMVTWDRNRTFVYPGGKSCQQIP